MCILCSYKCLLQVCWSMMVPALLSRFAWQVFLCPSDRQPHNIGIAVECVVSFRSGSQEVAASVHECSAAKGVTNSTFVPYSYTNMCPTRSAARHTTRHRITDTLAEAWRMVVFDYRL